LGTSQYGGKKLEAKTNFIADVSYNTKGWKDGNDLRNDKQLKEKIATLYQKLAVAIKNKDTATLSNLFLQMGEEQMVYEYGQTAGKLIDMWERWLMAFDNTNVLKVETDFDIEVSEDGKLICAMPNTQNHMLRAIGKKTAIGFTHFMYEDKATNELKFIR
jgi:hypothetical protein